MRQEAFRSSTLEHARLPGDHAVIRGVRVDLDTVVNPALFRTADKLSTAFRSAKPFPHLVIDGLFSPTLLELVADEFDTVAWNGWDRYDSSNEVKRGSGRLARFGHATQLYFATIHSRRFVRFVERVSAVESLLPDPDLFAGGLHEIPPGGHFAVHVDFNRHPRTGLDNRLVLITYLNKDWQRSFGGSLELWDADNQAKMVEIEPVFGRTIVFAQSPNALHGHPDPVRTPDGRPRRSVAAYYYTSGTGEGTYQTTQFPVRAYRRHPVLQSLRYLTPPIVFEAARAIARRTVQHRS